MTLRRNKPLRGTPKPCCGRSLCSCGEPPKLKRTPIRPAPKAKREERFARNYGSKEYVAFLHSFPCGACGVSGWTEAAHTETGGMGMKAGPETLVPLCGTRHGIEGCHQIYDTHPWDLPEGTQPHLRAMAKALWRMWEQRTTDDTE